MSTIRSVTLGAFALVAAMQAPLRAQGSTQTVQLAFGYECGDRFLVRNDGTNPVVIEYAVAGSEDRSRLHLNGKQSVEIASAQSGNLELWVGGKVVASEPKGDRACAGSQNNSGVSVRPIDPNAATSAQPVDSGYTAPPVVVYAPPYDYYPYDYYGYPYYGYSPYFYPSIGIYGGGFFGGRLLPRRILRGRPARGRHARRRRARRRRRRRVQGRRWSGRPALSSASDRQRVGRMERCPHGQRSFVHGEQRVVQSVHCAVSVRLDAQHHEAAWNPLRVEGEILASHDGRKLRHGALADAARRPSCAPSASSARRSPPADSRFPGRPRCASHRFAAATCTTHFANALLKVAEPRQAQRTHRARHLH